MKKIYNSLGENRDVQLKNESFFGNGNSSNSTKTKWFLSALVLFCMFFTGLKTNAQVNVTGTGNATPAMSASYATLALAVADVNNRTAISGPVTLTLASAQTAPAGGYSLTNVAITGGSNTNRFIFDGAGFTVTAGVGTSTTTDAIFKIIGADFISLQNFVMNESGANITQTTQIEWGVAVLYATTTNGAQNITIQGNTITLNRTNTNTFGIYSNSTHAAGSPTISATATTAAGGNHNLKVYSNTISNVNLGIVVVGPTAIADVNTGLEIGGTALGNSITNYGTSGTFSGYANVSGTVNGVLVRNSNGFVVSNNTITSSVGGVTAGTLNGIQIQAASNTPTATFTNNINNNAISLRSGLIAGAMNGITYPSGSASTTSVLNINSNDFNTFGHTVAGTGTINFINILSTNFTTSISNNTFTNISVNTTGSVALISHSFTAAALGTKTVNGNSIVGTFAKTGAGGTINLILDNGSTNSGATSNCQNNNFSNGTLTGATTLTGISYTDGGTAATRTVSGNTINNWTAGTSSVTAMNFTYWNGVSSFTNNTVTNISGQGIITGINIGSTINTATSVTIANNTVTNLTSTGTGGAVTGLACSNTSTLININNNAITTLASTGAAAVIGISITGATTTNVFKNTISNLSGSNASSTVSGIAVTNGTTVNTSNNRVGDLRAPNANAANPVNGINITGGTNQNVYYNTVNLAATSVGALFGSSAVSVSTTPTVTLNNNNLVNTSTANGAGLAVAYRRSSATLTTHGANSNRNNYNASTVYTDGTTPQASIGAFKALVGPTRDANSINVSPSFLSTTSGNVNFLKLDPAIASQLESGAANISGITDDFENEVRQGNPGYLAQVNGGGTAPDIGADEYDGIPAPVCAGTPAAATVTGATSICSSTGTTLGLSTVYTDLGITYQWKVASVSGGPYVNLGTSSSQATGNLATTMYYLCTITCTNSGLFFDTLEYTLTVNPAQAVSVSPASVSICPAGSTVLTAVNESYTVTGTLEGSQEVPAVSPAGSGTVKAVYNAVTNVLTMNVAYSGMTSNLNGAHIHGPAAPGANAGVLVSLPASVVVLGGTSGNLTGTVTLTASDETNLFAGLLYVNLHTVNNAGGEVRAQLAAVVNTPASYSWLPVLGLSNASIQAPTASPATGTTYTVTATGTGGCSNSGSSTVSIASLPDAVTITPTTPTICSGAIQMLTASGGGSVGTSSTIGAGTGFTTATGEQTAFCNRRLNYVGQTIYTAAELTAAGVTPGNITSLAYNISSNGDATTNANFTVKIGHVGATAIFPSTSFFANGAYTTVFGPATYTHASPGFQTITFSTPFVWNGIDNICIDVRHDGIDSINNAQTQFTTTGNASLFGFNTPAVGTLSTSKLNIRLGFSNPATSIIWAPTTNLFTDAGATIAYTGSPSTTVVYAQLAATQAYTATSTNATGCQTVGNVTVTVSAGAAITTDPSATAKCVGETAIFTVVATGPSLTYQWQKGGSPLANGGNISGADTATLTISNVTAADADTYDVIVSSSCGSPVTSLGATLTVNPLPATTTASGAGTFCTSTTITASNGSDGAMYFQGTTSGGTSTATASASEVVTSSGTYYFRAQSALGCWGPEGSVSVIIETPAGITGTDAIVCEGASGTMVAIAANGCINYVDSGTAIAGAWTAGSPSADRPNTSTNSATCGFATSTPRNYEATNFQVNVAGTYTFEMDDNAGYDGMGYLVTGAFTPGSCATGTFIKGDDDSGSGDEPIFTATLSTGVTYTLIATNFATAVLVDTFNWTITPPVGGQIMLPVSGSIEWYTAASGGASIGSGSPFNPVGVAGSGLADTNTPGTTTYYAACSNSSTCRTAVNFVINANVTYYADVDGDSFGGAPVLSCTGQPIGTVTNNTDCDDNNNLIWQTGSFYVDADGDNYSPGLGTTILCYGATEPTGFSLSNLGLDCDDAIAAINPGQSEILYDGVDNNCDGNLDEGFQLLTQIQAGTCGTTLASISSLISAVSSPATLITGYRFEVTRVGSSPLEVQTIDRPSQYFNLTQLPLYAYASTYSIRVMLQKNGIWLGYYGTSCNVSSPAVLDPGGAVAVTPSQCGITLPTISSLIATTSLAGVTGYKFRVTNQRTLFQQELIRTLHWFSLNMLTQYVYGDTYTVEVAVKTTGIVYSGYGSPCNVTAPPVPSLTSQCNTIIPAKSTNIATSSLNLVTSYDFEVKNMVSNAVANVSNNLNWFRLSMLPNYAQSTQFRVRVRVLSSGVFSDYGDACFITSPAIARAVETVNGNEFEVTASPNPFDNNFGMFLNSTSTEDVSIRVYDMIGKLVEQREVKSGDVVIQEIGARFPSGVYNVVVTQGTEVKTLRMIKR